MATTKTWKSVERRGAAEFMTDRTPLSGGNSKQTRSDSRHDDVFIEMKHRQGGFATTNLLKSTAKLAKLEGKTPCVMLHEKGAHQVVIACYSGDLFTIAQHHLSYLKQYYPHFAAFYNANMYGGKTCK